MDSIGQISRHLFDSGFYCAESVLLAVARHEGLESPLIPRIASGFGAGMSRTSGLCGALTGGIMALNLLFGRDTPEESLKDNFGIVARFIREFEGSFGSSSCPELLGCDITTKEGAERFTAEDLGSKICAEITGKTGEIIMALLDSRP